MAEVEHVYFTNDLAPFTIDRYGNAEYVSWCHEAQLVSQGLSLACSVCRRFSPVSATDSVSRDEILLALRERDLDE